MKYKAKTSYADLDDKKNFKSLLSCSTHLRLNTSSASSTGDVYNNYNEDIDEDESLGGSVMPTPKMGYLSSVKNARKDLEDLFKKDIKDT